MATNKKIFLLCFFLLTTVLISRPWGKLTENISYSRIIQSSDGTPLRLTLSHDDKYRLPIANEVPEDFLNALLLKEDKYFYYHLGVNPVSLLDSFINTYIRKKTFHGASTITMQLARLKYKIRTKSVLGKINQVFLATYIELLYSKKDILKMYLTIAPYGKNIEGLKAASFIYFKKDYHLLNVEDFLLLASLPQSPSILNKHSSYSLAPSLLIKKRNRLAKIWNKAYPLKKIDSYILNTKPYLYSIKDINFSAPHFSRFILKSSFENLSPDVLTTLDIKKQKKTKEILDHYIAQIKTKIYKMLPYFS